jgi:ankyrin repeat protein
VIETLLSRGANIDASDRTGRTPLHAAVENGTGYNLADDVVKFLLTKGADVNARSRADSTPFHTAISSWNENTVKLA